MALEKILNARFVQKTDTYANWTDETLGEGKGALCVLKRGEIGFCEIPSGGSAATTAPTILFKVGDGTSAFKDLKWGSALAADVYGWAKAETVELVNEKLTFKNKDGSVAKEVDLSAFATDAKVEELLGGYYTKAEIDDKVEAINETIADLDVSALNDRIDNIENVTIPTLATKEELADEVETLEGAIADVDAKFAGYYTKTEVDAAHDLKADKTQVATDIETAVNAEKERAMDVEAGLRTDVNAAATKEYVDAELAKKQNSIPENTYDAYGAAADVKDYADETFATKVALGEEATARANADQAIRDDMATALALKADKTYVDETFATKTALAAEVERAAGIEGGLRTDVDAVIARVEAFLDNTGAATDAIDTLQELLTYIETHDDVEISGILADIQRLMNILDGFGDEEEPATVMGYITEVVAALEKKITDAEGGYAAADAALKAELQKEIDDDVAAEATLRDAADVELGKRIDAEAKTREDADKALDERVAELEKIDHDAYVDADATLKGELQQEIDDDVAAEALLRENADKTLGERIDAIVADETGILAVAKKYTDDEIDALGLGDMSKETAADYVKKTEAPGFADILTKTDAANLYQGKGEYATAEQGAKADTAVQTVTAVEGNGIKATRTGNDVVLDWDTNVVFVFNAGSSTTVI